MNSKTILMKAAVVTAGMAASITLGSVEAAHAATINTASSWNGFSYISAFGEPDTATYGQTFTVETDNVLQGFSFQLGGFAGGTVDFAAYVMGWDGMEPKQQALFFTKVLSKQNLQILDFRSLPSTLEELT